MVICVTPIDITVRGAKKDVDHYITSMYLLCYPKRYIQSLIVL